MSRRLLSSAVVLIVCMTVFQPRFPSFADDPLVSTFSIAAIDLENGDVGVAVQSKFPNVRRG